MSTVIFNRVRVFDGHDAPADTLFDVVVADGTIQEIVDADAARLDDADIVACEGRTLMPGLIDAHVHVYLATMRLDVLVNKPQSYLACHATNFLRGSLDRGFTTIRDVGGADIGLATALRDGLVNGPRLFYGGRSISQTGGHSDARPADFDAHNYCSCGLHAGLNALAVVADGVDAVRAAVREELRRGAHHIKIMGSGGVMSPTDPIDRCQYSEEEIRTAVEEATRHGAYVAAHCHPREAIRRCVEYGVRSIEHGTMIDEETARFVAERDAFVVPTMAVIFALLDGGDRYGLPAASRAKLELVADDALRGVEIMHRAGVKVGFGTDLLAEQHVLQSTEFTLRSRVVAPLDILRSACAVNAELVGEPERLGCVRPGAHADLLLIDGDPLADIALLTDPAKMPVVMKAGNFYRNAL